MLNVKVDIKAATMKDLKKALEVLIIESSRGRFIEDAVGYTCDYTYSGFECEWAIGTPDGFIDQYCDTYEQARELKELRKNVDIYHRDYQRNQMVIFEETEMFIVQDACDRVFRRTNSISEALDGIEDIDTVYMFSTKRNHYTIELIPVIQI